MSKVTSAAGLQELPSARQDENSDQAAAQGVQRRTLWWELAFVLLVTAAALAVRLYRLHDFPPGLYEDEAANGLDVFDILKGHFSVFFPRNNGRESLFIYLQALSIYWLGPTPYALRLTAALVGAATIPAFYWLTRTLFANEAHVGPGTAQWTAQWTAGWAALFLAFSYWHLSFSRLGFRAITLPLLACLTFAFFWRALRRLKGEPGLPWRDLILCGFFVGVSLYTYTSSRTIPFVIGSTLVATVFLGMQPRLDWRRGLAALAVIGLVALAVFAPLGLYFFNNWDVFLERSGEVSIFNPVYAPDGPLWALGRSAVRTVLMFVSLADTNLRHNPGERLVFDWLLAAWLAVGVALALVRWRQSLAQLLLFWFGWLAVPAVLTAQSIPHSLRTIGMMPAAYLLSILGMRWASTRLAGRLGRLALWLPLPFLLFSSITGVHDYFAAWQDISKFYGAFLTDYVKVGQMIGEHSSPDSVWVLPRSPNHELNDAPPAMQTVNFMVRDQAGYGTVIFGEAYAPQELTALTQDRHFVHVLQIQDAEFLSRSSLVFADTKNLLDFLLYKHGQRTEEIAPMDIGVPYKTFKVRPGATYLFSQNPLSTTIRLGDKVELVQLDYGRTVLDLDEPTAALTERRAPAGHALWAVLRWQALTPIDYDLKISLTLKDAAGHVAAQVDQLLTGDHYPVLRVWEMGERASTYHILPIPPALPPGEYQLYAKVYENENGRVYPIEDATGAALGLEVPLGPFTLTPGPTGVALTPERPLTGARLAPELVLNGFDLPRPTVAPGDQLPIVFYWQALAPPLADYTLHVQLLDGAGATLAEETRPLGGAAYPTSQWRSGETLRHWLDLPLAPTTPAGVYDLVASLTRDGQEIARQALGQVTVQGRVRQFDPPALTQPVAATFGQHVRLLGIADPVSPTLTAGETVSLTLAWQAMTTAPPSLVRFIHLLGPDGQPVAQQDTVPCNAECPSTSWLTDEILLDPATLVLPADLAAGSYRLAIGWYEEETQERLTATDEENAPLANNLLELPVAVQVQS